MPYCMPQMRPAPHSRAVSYTPARLELITAVGPPLCPTRKFIAKPTHPLQNFDETLFLLYPIYKSSAMFRAAFSYIG